METEICHTGSLEESQIIVSNSTEDVCLASINVRNMWSISYVNENHGYYNICVYLCI